MSRYIDADKLNECMSIVQKANRDSIEFNKRCRATDVFQDIWGMIKAQPTADVVKVTSEQYDCVSREKVRDLLHEYMDNEDFTIGRLDDCYCEMPSLDVRENVKGEWLEPNGVLTFLCSNCGYVNNSANHWNYCPNCGARMVEE